MSYTLIGTPVSLYTGKVRGYLRWKNVAFTERLSTREVFKADILPRVGWSVIPVVIHEDGSEDGVTLQDTTDIIDHVEACEPGPSVYPDTPRQRLAALILELFGDEWLVIPAMHYRWAYNRDFAQQEFGATSHPHLPPEEQFVAAEKAVGFFSGSITGLGINPDSVAAIEAAYEDFLAVFEAHLGEHDNLFGSRPSIGDYGLLGPLYAHLLRDPKSGELMRRLAPRVARWAERCHAPQHSLTGDFLPDDEIPAGVEKLLQRFAAQHWPVLRDTADALAGWAADKAPGTELPRILGFHKAVIGHGDSAVTTDRAIIPFPLWMLQRVTDYRDGLVGEARRAVGELLRSMGAADLDEFTLPVRLQRRNFKLALAD
ncbi:glutathione S-transferase family protein [Maricaulis maris]|uniref:Glutathione S-transferase n=1 Tax=Maricaulis maris TaxID=74318 RepID=A0A495DLW9_9PROT|nr:glutathione S-transferase family protein [Maricaulis maris]RKR03914.1 glutathione S-transferase [Maricaulis maris]